MATVPNTPAVADSVYPNYAGVVINTPGASHKTTHDPDKLWTEFTFKPWQDELLKHQQLLNAEDTIVAKTANYVILAADSRKTFTNAGAAGSVQFTALKSSGQRNRIARTSNHAVTIIPSSGSIIFGDTSGTTLTLTSAAGEAIIWSDGTNIYVSSISGNWTLA